MLTMKGREAMESLDPIYSEMAAKLGQKNSKYLPRILAKLASPEQARVVRELPSTPEEISKKLNLARATVESHIQELIEKGLVFPTKRGPQMARTIEQIHDAALGNPKYDAQLGAEYFDLFAEFMDHEVLDDMIKIYVTPDGPRFRIIPRWKSIENVPGVLPWEDIREIIRSQETLALLNCPCKREHRGRSCGVPVQVCINVGRTAQYNIKRGAGRKITAEEALRVIEETDAYPMVHLSLNQAEVNQLVCNCHRCCCSPLIHMLTQKKHSLTEGIAKSRFEAAVDPAKCKACKACLAKCQFGAVRMTTDAETNQEHSSVDPEKCMGCGSCVVSCRSSARSMKLVRPPEHVPREIARLY
jgi:NAD-dependent dihydropyrimidine dehydrogenase PreA subunit